MTAEEIFCDLFEKYGEDFNWYMVPFSQSNGIFGEELKKEINEVFDYNWLEDDEDDSP